MFSEPRFILQKVKISRHVETNKIIVHYFTNYKMIFIFWGSIKNTTT